MPKQTLQQLRTHSTLAFTLANRTDASAKHLIMRNCKLPSLPLSCTGCKLYWLDNVNWSIVRLNCQQILRLCDQKQGIKKDDQETLQVLSRSAWYAETSIKLLGTITPCTNSRGVLYYLNRNRAHTILTGWECYTDCTKINKFNKNTVQMFRSLQKNTSGLSPNHFKDLKLASKITARTASASSPTATLASTDVNWRDRRHSGYSYRDGFNNRNYCRHGQVRADIYSQYSTRSVPPQQPS